MSNQNKSPARENASHLLFLEQASETGCIWGLQNEEEGWALCESSRYEDTPVMPFWSVVEQAKLHIQGEWKDYQVIPVSLEEFLDDWLTGLHEDVILVGLNWDKNLEGDEYEPLDLLHEFEQAFSS